MTKLVTLALTLWLAGCTGAVHLQHPVTGRTATCGPYANVAGWKYTAIAHERGCVDDFQRQGYQRVP